MTPLWSECGAVQRVEHLLLFEQLPLSILRCSSYARARRPSTCCTCALTRQAPGSGRAHTSSNPTEAWETNKRHAHVQSSDSAACAARRRTPMYGTRHMRWRADDEPKRAYAARNDELCAPACPACQPVRCHTIAAQAARRLRTGRKPPPCTRCPPRPLRHRAALLFAGTRGNVELVPPRLTWRRRASAAAGTPPRPSTHQWWHQSRPAPAPAAVVSSDERREDERGRNDRHLDRTNNLRVARATGRGHTQRTALNW